MFIAQQRGNGITERPGALIAVSSTLGILCVFDIYRKAQTPPPFWNNSFNAVSDTWNVQNLGTFLVAPLFQVISCWCFESFDLLLA